jgi:hypothetical protein
MHAGRKFVERASPGPRPEKPIELYEFEGFVLFSEFVDWKSLFLRQYRA